MRSLRQFVVVADCGSISRAAARLNISQPTLSRAIRNLEASRGAALFDRHGEGVTLTQYGQILYARAISILNEYDRANEEIRQLQGSGKVSLRIAAGDLWGYVHLPPAVREYSDRYPDILVDVEIVSHANRLDGLRNGTYDLVFGIIDPAVEALYSMTFLKLKKEGFHIYGDRGHPLCSLTRVRKGDLAKHRWINHQFEFGLNDDAGEGHQRDYAVKANTLLSAIQVMRGSELLISASSGFDELFETFGMAAICNDTTRQVLDSGAIFWGDLQEKPVLRHFVEAVKRQVAC